MPISDFFRRQLNRYRDLLANLSRRNKELFYREGRGHCINLSKPPTVDPEFQSLIEDQFQSFRATSDGFQELIKNGSLNLTKHFLLNETGNPDLLKRLDKIRLADEKFKREYGISGAWLLGPFLCWRAQPGYSEEDLLVSPIFKIPVNISKDKRKQWKLDLEDTALAINPTLQLALRQNWGIALPDEFDSEHVIDALEIIKIALAETGKSLHLEGYKYDAIPKILARFKNIKNEDGEIIERRPRNLNETLSAQDLEVYQRTTQNDFTLIDVIYIDHLNASRAVLISDYDSILESADGHPILSELFLGKPISVERGIDREQIKALDSYKENENYFVVNIDSTQHRAIDQASKSRAIVIQGPPGTGKSQTITNLIAESLAKGKKVLFVSEKRPALDVVFSRLKQANLASQAVLIHSSDLSKQDLYKSFLELSSSVPDQNTDQQWGQTTASLDKVKSELNGYFQILENIHQPSGLHISDLFVHLANALDGTANPKIAKLFAHLDSNSLRGMSEILNELQGNVLSIPKYANHPWLNRKLDTIYSDTLLHNLSELLKRLNQAEQTHCFLNDQIRELCAAPVDSIPETENITKVARFPIRGDWISAANLAYLDETIPVNYQQQIAESVLQVETEMDQCSLIRSDADYDVIRQLERYYSVKRGFFYWFSLTFWRMRKYQRQYCLQWSGDNRPFRSFRLVREAIATLRSYAQATLIPITLNENFPATALITQAEALPIIQAAAELGKMARGLGLISSGKFAILSEDTHRELSSCLLEIAKIRDQIKQSHQTLGVLRADLANYFDKVPDFVAIDNSNYYKELLKTVMDLDKLDRVDLCLASLQKIGGVSIPRELIISDFLPVSQPWGAYASDAVVRSWVDDARSKYPELRTFENSIFESRGERFRKLENDHRVAARDFVNNTLSKRWNSGIGSADGLSLLKTEANKQRRVLSPRELMERGALDAMMKLKPCWLMSPLSISQILPMKDGLFDLIIFDEASQVRVEDAVPSIYRAKAMVVVGDPKQMPPTNFFASNESVDDDEDEVEIAMSVLDLAAQVYPPEILEWHYRSRSEALIAFSNRAFYGGRLIAVPNPHLMTEGGAIKFHRIEDAYFNHKVGNSHEAKLVAAHLAKILDQNPSCSVGIIAMGQTQMVAIEDAIDQMCTGNPKFQESIERARSFKDGDADAGLFIKNLENVQGDERDIILISVGYAASRLGKKVYQNFGPLSKQGGGRRLNVAITRAKQKIEIFCSFDPSQISTDELAFGKNPDLTLFGRYLKYASAISDGRTSEAMSLLASFGVSGPVTTRKSSSFSKDVQRRLEEIGYKVSPEIGSSGFYIDLGIHHPVIPSNFVLGIECDGAMFHSTPYARDRDKIRQELLEARGWRIVRVWSQDWSRDWRNEVTKLDTRLREILGTSKQGDTKMSLDITGKSHAS